MAALTELPLPSPSVAALAGFASLRLLGILVHRGRVRSAIWFGLALELLGVALSAWGLTRVGGAAI